MKITDSSCKNMLCEGVTKHNLQCKKKASWVINDKSYCHVHVAKKTQQCSICLNSIIDAQYLPCGHYYHKKCINKWLKNNNTCPFCRSIFSRGQYILLNSYNHILNMIDDNFINIAIEIALQSKDTCDFQTHIKNMGII